MRPISFLDSREAMAELDISNSLGSIEQLGQQVQHIWQEVGKLEFDPSYAQVTSVVVAGMGGSALGTHVIQTLFREQLKVPVIIAPEYTVPNFVDEHTLVIASSYSGSTEETLAAAQDAITKGAKITGITTGGALAELLAAHNVPRLVYEPTHNPCNSPRMALGYSIFGQIGLLSKIGLLSLSQADIESVLHTIAAAQVQYSADAPQESNPAKHLAFQLVGKIPVLIVSEHLEGVAHVFANQLNENSKTYSEYRVVPELNHHLLEGLQFPSTNDETFFMVTAHSNLYQEKNQIRMRLTQEVLEQQHVDYQPIEMSAGSKLDQAFEYLVFGSYVNYYLAMLNNVNPEPIPIVDWFKQQLKK